MKAFEYRGRKRIPWRPIRVGDMVAMENGEVLKVIDPSNPAFPVVTPATFWERLCWWRMRGPGTLRARLSWWWARR